MVFQTLVSWAKMVPIKVLISPHLKFHDVTTSRSSNKACPDGDLLGVELANVARLLIVVDDLER